MTKDELLEKLSALAEGHDSEHAHAEADKALIEFIDDDEITAAYQSVEKWYA